MDRPLADLLPHSLPENVPATTVASSILHLLDSSKDQTPGGPEIHADLATHITSLIREGLPKTQRASYTAACPRPANCSALQPPALNPEVKSCLSSPAVQSDQFLQSLQSQLAAGLSAVLIPLNAQVLLTSEAPTESNKEQLEKLGHPVKLLADVFHSLPFLDQDVKSTLDACPLDEYLFGKQLSEHIKTSKDTQRLGATVKRKIQPSSTGWPQIHRRTSLAEPRLGPSGISLNSRRALPKSRLKPPPQKKEREQPQNRSYRSRR